MKRNIRIQLYLSSLVLTVMGITVLLMCYWLFWPVDVLTINKVELITDKVKPGGQLVYKLEYSKHYRVSGEITKQLIGTNGTKASWAMLDKTGGVLPCGDNLTIVTGAFIPMITTPGTYILRTSVRYQINPLRYFHEDFDTPPFEVVK